MRRLFAAGIATFAVCQSPALASVSDDLVFCSKLTSPRERIACYDAAARIAANVGRSISQPVTTQMASSPTAATGRPYKATAPTEKAPFHGPYVAIGGGYGIAGPVAFGAVDDISGFGGTGRPSGPSALAIAGLNLQYGHLVTGLELSGRFGREGFSDSQFATVNTGDFGTIGQSLKSYRFNSDASAHVSLRAGLAVENALIYGKLGIGAGHISEAMQVSTIGTRCIQAGFVGGIITCTNRISITPARSTSTSAWLPSVLLGTGVEHNFGLFFARIEGQAEAIRGANVLNEWLWTMRAIGAVGFRF